MKIVIAAFAFLVACEAKTYTLERQTYNDVNKMNKSNDDTGSFASCNPAQDFTLQWKPKNIDVSKGTTIQVFFDMISGFDWSSGEVCYTFWLPPYEDPIYEGCQDADCSLIPKEAKLLVKCPLAKGDHLSVKWLPVKIPTEVQIPPATFTVKLELHNQDKSPFFCAKGDITITNSGDKK